MGIGEETSIDGTKADGEWCAERFALLGRQPSPSKRKSPTKQDSPRKKAPGPLEPFLLGKEKQCTCPILPLSPLASSASDKSQKNEQIISSRSWKICASSQCRNRAEFKRFKQLRDGTLLRERLRSDPLGTWEQHLKWSENDPLAVRHPQLFSWVCGRDILDSKDEEFVDFEPVEWSELSH